jgi:hypothetical protein
MKIASPQHADNTQIFARDRFHPERLPGRQCRRDFIFWDAAAHAASWTALDAAI